MLALWLTYTKGDRLTRGRALLDHALLVVHVAAGLFAAWKDIRLPFANLDRIVELVGEVPPGSRLVTDYWTMNAYSAFVDKPIYCVGRCGGSCPSSCGTEYYAGTFEEKTTLLERIPRDLPAGRSERGLHGVARLATQTVPGRSQTREGTSASLSSISKRAPSTRAVTCTCIGSRPAEARARMDRGLSAASDLALIRYGTSSSRAARERGRKRPRARYPRHPARRSPSPRRGSGRACGGGSGRAEAARPRA